MDNKTEIRLKTGESYTNNTGKIVDVQTSYINAVGCRQNHFGIITPGMSITKTKPENIVIIYINY